MISIWLGTWPSELGPATSSSLLKLPEPGPSAHSLNNSDLAPSRRTFNSRYSAAWSSAEGAAVGLTQRTNAAKVPP